MTTDAAEVVDFAELDLASLKLDDEASGTDRLVPFYLGADDLSSVSLERRFSVGIESGPALLRACWEQVVLTITIQYVMNRESRRRMLLDVAKIWRALRTQAGRFTAAQMKPPEILSIQYDYTSVLGFVGVTFTVGYEYHVEPTVTLEFHETPAP